MKKVILAVMVIAFALFIRFRICLGPGRSLQAKCAAVMVLTERAPLRARRWELRNFRLLSCKRLPMPISRFIENAARRRKPCTLLPTRVSAGRSAKLRFT